MSIRDFNSQPVMCRISNIKDECKDTRTFFLEQSKLITKVKPGQFVMLWVPGIDEYPVGVAGYEKNILELCVAKRGEGTNVLFQKQEGDLVGIRGFFGKWFKPQLDCTHILVGGGFGMPPLKFLMNELLNSDMNKKILIFQGARSKNLHLYSDLFTELEKKEKIQFFPYTDDGSFGTKGYPTTGVKNYLEQHKGEKVMIYSAGPEIMMKVLYDIGQQYEIVQDMQMSLADRYMRCGFGLCGSCVVDPTGLRICIDGPVFSTTDLQKIDDFGKYDRGPSGLKKEL